MHTVLYITINLHLLRNYWFPAENNMFAATAHWTMKKQIMIFRHANNDRSFLLKPS